MKTLKELREHIIKTGGGYKLLSKKTGKNLGTATSLAGIKKREREVEYFKHVHEDGMGGGAMGGVPANNVGSGNIAGSGGQGGEPGVSKKRNPIMMKLGRRNPPKM